jgi:hypothetical protein
LWPDLERRIGCSGVAFGAVDEVDDVGQQARPGRPAAHRDRATGARSVEAEARCASLRFGADRSGHSIIGWQRGHRAHDSVALRDDLIADEPRPAPPSPLSWRQRLGPTVAAVQCREGEGREPHVRSFVVSAALNIEPCAFRRSRNIPDLKRLDRRYPGPSPARSRSACANGRSSKSAGKGRLAPSTENHWPAGTTWRMRSDRPTSTVAFVP